MEAYLIARKSCRLLRQGNSLKQYVNNVNLISDSGCGCIGSNIESDWDKQKGGAR